MYITRSLPKEVTRCGTTFGFQALFLNTLKYLPAVSLKQ